MGYGDKVVEVQYRVALIRVCRESAGWLLRSVMSGLGSWDLNCISTTNSSPCPGEECLATVVDFVGIVIVPFP